MKALLRAPYSLGWVCGGPLWALHTAIASLRLRGEVTVEDRRFHRTAAPANTLVDDGGGAATVDAGLRDRLPCAWSALVAAAHELTAPLALALVQSGLANAGGLAMIEQESDRARLTRLESPLWIYELLTDDGRRLRNALRAIAARGPEWNVDYPKTESQLLAFAIRATLQVS